MIRRDRFVAIDRDTAFFKKPIPRRNEIRILSRVAGEQIVQRVEMLRKYVRSKCAFRDRTG